MILINCLFQDDIMKILLGIFILCLVQFSPLFAFEQNCSNNCVCPRIYFPHCDSRTTVMFDNECIAKCHQTNCPRSKYFYIWTLLMKKALKSNSYKMFWNRQNKYLEHGESKNLCLISVCREEKCIWGNAKCPRFESQTIIF